MIDRTEILAVATDLSLAPDVVEKDYALGWLLAGIYAHDKPGSAWAFKGGTCLKKCYFETYRFSEDLDFTISDQSHLDEGFLKATFAEIATWLYGATGLEFPADQLDSMSTETSETVSPARAASTTAARLAAQETSRASSWILPSMRSSRCLWSNDPSGIPTATCPKVSSRRGVTPMKSYSAKRSEHSGSARDPATSMTSPISSGTASFDRQPR